MYSLYFFLHSSWFVCFCGGFLMNSKEIIFGIVFGLFLGLFSWVLEIWAVELTGGELHSLSSRFSSIFLGMFSAFLGIAVARLNKG